MNKYNTFWRRLIAVVIDSLILWPIAFIDGYVEDSANKVFFTIGELLLSAIYLTYFIFLHGKYGQTAGKKIMNIKVVDINESSLLGIRRALLRELPWLLSNIIIFTYLLIVVFLISHTELQQAKNNYNNLISGTACAWVLIELITMLTNYKRRAIHDYLAKSVVVKLAG
jgi:uncharacterized RDD family membrane protein YckC